MIGYTTVGANDLTKAAAFYEPLMSSMGASRIMEDEKLVLWGRNNKAPMFGIIKPFDGKPASVGNGTMIALMCDSTEQVDELHAKALSLGAIDEGEVGPRGDNFYGGYFRDLDGNKLVFFNMV